MTLIDANLLVYAYVVELPQHKAARAWLEGFLNGESSQVFLSWATVIAFIRITTNRKVFKNALDLKTATSVVRQWFQESKIRVLNPTELHWEIFAKQLQQSKATGNLVSDAHLAALCFEHNCTLMTTDRDFGRFLGLKFVDPLVLS
jgi:uncharacterized protein